MTCIYLYCPSPAQTLAFTPDMLYGRGLGGAEQSLVLLTREWARRGHRVHVFNNSDLVDELFDGVHYHHKRFFPLWAREDGEPKIEFSEPDVLIIYRAPAETITEWVRMLWRKTAVIGWSTDQATEGNYYAWLAQMDRVVTISDFHTRYFIDRYHADPKLTQHIDLPIAARDYEVYNESPRDNLFLWSSQPERGLSRVALVWPSIRHAIPDARLVITADHRLWGVTWNAVYESHQRGYREMFLPDEGVEFLAAIPRAQLVAIQKQAKLQLSSLTYEELFCISVMEGQAAGAVPVVGSMGALPTTVMVGECVKGNLNRDDPLDEWAQRVIAWARNPELPVVSRAAHRLALSRCHPSSIADQWEVLFRSCAKE